MKTRNKKARFPIGLTYRSNNKRRDLTTIVDILSTINSSGEIIRIEYVVSHEFTGQAIRETVPDTRIARALEPHVLAEYTKP